MSAVKKFYDPDGYKEASQAHQQRWREIDAAHK